MTTGSDHLDLWAYESAACEPTEWEHWINAVEAILGHSADGDGNTDGYSLDDFYDQWKQGLSPVAATATIRGAAGEPIDTRGWRRWPSDRIEKALEHIDDSTDLWDKMSDELSEREHEYETRVLNGGVLP